MCLLSSSVCLLEFVSNPSNGCTPIALDYGSVVFNISVKAADIGIFRRSSTVHCSFTEY